MPVLAANEAIGSVEGKYTANGDGVAKADTEPTYPKRGCFVNQAGPFKLNGIALKEKQGPDGGSGTMMRWVGRWLLRVLVAIAAISLVAFAVDSAVYLMRGSPQSEVAVSQFMLVPLKGGKTEYDYLGTANIPCAVALFPHAGKDPCWNLRRNPNQWEKVGTPAY